LDEVEKSPNIIPNARARSRADAATRRVVSSPSRNMGESLNKRTKRQSAKGPELIMILAEKYNSQINKDILSLLTCENQLLVIALFPMAVYVVLMT
jgi:hypothetical protein